MPDTTKNTGNVRHEPAPNPVQYETSVYQNGLRYESPPFTFHSNQWEPEAAKAMSANSAGYAIGNAGSGETARKNVDAFKRWSIVPKRLVKSEELPDLGTRVLGEEFQFPVAAGPVGVLRMFDLLVAVATMDMRMAIWRSNRLQESSTPTENSPSLAHALRTMCPT